RRHTRWKRDWRSDVCSSDLKEMEFQRKGHNIHVVGVTNVGKSTFINKYIDNATGLKEVITTSYFPGTTLGFIEIPLDDNTSLIRSEERRVGKDSRYTLVDDY